MGTLLRTPDAFTPPQSFHELSSGSPFQVQVFLCQRAAEGGERHEQDERVSAGGAAGEGGVRQVLSLLVAALLHLFVCLWTESMQKRGGERTAA